MPSEATTPAEILVVDDDPSSRAVLRHALSTKGHEVREANDGEEALRVVVEKPPDLVLCDMQMPGLSGIDVLRKLRSDETTQRLPFILVTGESDHASRLKGIEAGADDYLTKPVELGTLFARTWALLRAKRLDDEVRRQRRVIDSLLTISAFSPGYLDASTRLFSDFTKRTGDLLRAKHVAIFLERRGEEPEVISCWPPRDHKIVVDKIDSTQAVGQLLIQASPLLINADDEVAQRELDLTEGFAGVPIFSLEGRVIGGVVAFGIPVDLRPESLQILMTLAQRTGSEVQMRDHSERLEQLVEERTAELRAALEKLEDAKGGLEHAHEETVFRLAMAAEFRDNETANHLRRMGRYSEMLARKTGMAEDQIAIFRYASLMHDIGKIGIPDHILQKPGRLTEEEYDIMKTHTVLGSEILGGSDAPMLQMSQRVALSHHEKWNGTGYPNGVAGEEIPIEARIVAVADVFDALTSHRRYKDAWTHDEAFAHLEESAGTHLDPTIAAAFLDMQLEIMAVAMMLADDPEQQAG